MRSISFLILTLAFCQGLTAQQVNWLQHVGTTMHDIGSAVDLAPNGDVVVVGYYESGTPMDFDAGPGVYNYGDFGLFIARYAPTGEVLHVQHCMSSLDHGFTTYPPGKEITMRCAPVSGNIYIAGDSDVGTGDLRVIKTDPLGNLLWERDYYLGPNSDTRWRAMDVDSLDNVYIAGDLEGTVDLDPGTATYNLSSFSTDFFITKLDSAGNFAWAVQNGDFFDTDNAASICVRDDSTFFLLTSESDNDVVGVYEYGTDGIMHWRVPITSQGGVGAYAIDLDNEGNIYIHVNCITQMDMDPFAGVQYFNGWADAIAKYDPTMHYRWHRRILHTAGSAMRPWF
ncbi:MAG: hypothetical protein IPG74_04385 [Flavobacteriales bacterium]|nr:hypothetical protein [Flavobacteriales bacterium]